MANELEYLKKGKMVMKKICIGLVMLLLVLTVGNIRMADAENSETVLFITLESFDFMGSSKQWKDVDAFSAYDRSRIEEKPPALSLEQLYFQEFWVRMSISSTKDMILRSILFDAGRSPMAWCYAYDMRLTANYEYWQELNQNEPIDNAFRVTVASAENTESAFIQALQDAVLAANIEYHDQDIEVGSIENSQFEHISLPLTFFGVQKVVYHKENGYRIKMCDLKRIENFRPSSYGLDSAEYYPWYLPTHIVAALQKTPELFELYELTGFSDKNMPYNVYGVWFSFGGMPKEGIWIAGNQNFSLSQSYIHDQYVNGTKELSILVLIHKDLFSGEIEDSFKNFDIVAEYHTEAYGSTSFWQYGPSFLTNVQYQRLAKPNQEKQQ